MRRANEPTELITFYSNYIVMLNKQKTSGIITPLNYNKKQPFLLWERLFFISLKLETFTFSQLAYIPVPLALHGQR